MVCLALIVVKIQFNGESRKWAFSPLPSADWMNLMSRCEWGFVYQAVLQRFQNKDINLLADISIYVKLACLTICSAEVNF